MKLFYYFVVENLGISIPRYDSYDDFHNENLQVVSNPSKKDWKVIRTSDNWRDFDYRIGYSGEHIAPSRAFLQVPSKDEIIGIESSENMNRPPIIINPDDKLPIGPCSNYCSPTPFRSLDSNDRTGDHEEF